MKDILIGIAYRTDEFKLIPFEKENINYEIFSPKNETDYSKYDGFYLPGGDGWYSEDTNRFIRAASTTPTVSWCAASCSFWAAR